MSVAELPGYFCLKSDSGEYEKFYLIERKGDWTSTARNAHKGGGYTLKDPSNITGEEKEWPIQKCDNCKHKMTCLLDPKADHTYELS